MTQSEKLLKKWDKARGKSGYPKNTFLRNWITNKIEAYQEPTRSNRLPSDKIGFSTVKYLSSIFLGTMTYTVKQTAELLNVSYNTLRRQHVEPEFVKKMGEARQEFAQSARRYIWDQLQQFDKAPVEKFKDLSYLNDETLKILSNEFYIGDWRERMERDEAISMAPKEPFLYILILVLPKERAQRIELYYRGEKLKGLLGELLNNENKKLFSILDDYKEEQDKLREFISMILHSVQKYIELVEKAG